MLAKVLRVGGWLAFVMFLAVCAAFAGYWSFSLFVRSGVTPVPVLVSLEESEAVALAADSGLEVKRREGAERYDESVAAGRVLEHSPAGGSLVKRGSTVEVVISLGPEMVGVPDLRVQALQAAQVTLTSAGLTVGRTAGIYCASGQNGTVAEQVPAPGERVGRAAPIDLFLCHESRLETYLMPDLVYRRYDEVERYFDRRGFRLGSVKFEVYEGIAAGIVLRQYPLPGHPLRRHDVISLVVAGEESAGV